MSEADEKEKADDCCNCNNNGCCCCCCGGIAGLLRKLADLIDRSEKD